MKLLSIPVVAIFLSGCSLFGVMTVEEPEYDVIVIEKPFEIREYGDLVTVETGVSKPYREASNEAFKRLFDYISGANQMAQKVSMTAPVTMQDLDVKLSVPPRFFEEKSETGWKMSFVLPDGFDLKNAPVPTSDLVSLRSIPGRKVAVTSFSGRWKVDSFNQASNELIGWLKDREVKAISAPRVAAFNPPWTIPFLRRNEVHVDIE